MSSELAGLSIATAARLIRSGEVRPTELLNASLEQIERHNEKLKAFITVCEESARKAATATELMLSAGYDLGPLHGIPLAIKDNVAIRGSRTTAGSKALEHWIPEKTRP